MTKLKTIFNLLGGNKSNLKTKLNLNNIFDKFVKDKEKKIEESKYKNENKKILLAGPNKAITKDEIPEELITNKDGSEMELLNPEGSYESGITSLVYEVDPDTVRIFTRDYEKVKWLVNIQKIATNLNKNFKSDKHPNRKLHNFDIYVLEMPMLFPLSRYNENQVIKEMKEIERIFSDLLNQVFYRDILREGDKDYYFQILADEMEDNKSEFPVLADFFIYCRDEGEDTTHYDVRVGNCMEDIDGNIVLLDPVVCGNLLESFTHGSSSTLQVSYRSPVKTQSGSNWQEWDGGEYKGIWKDGVWHKGTFKNGEWFDGEWWTGCWRDGVWHNGEWKYGTWANGVWWNGVWTDGVWINGVWHDGEWGDGIWENGEWMYGLWKKGEWEKGTWYGGNWEDGLWRNGIWHKGNWENGVWFNGSWRIGQWSHGIWHDGIWNNGEWFNGVWFGGNWYRGIWHDGKWYNGEWNSGKWVGGTWVKGKIFVSYVIKDYVDSVLNPKELFDKINPSMSKEEIIKIASGRK